MLFLWFAWQGRNWARIVLWVLGGLSVLGAGSTGSAADTGQCGFLTSLSVFQLLLLVAGLVLLALKPSNEWYRYRGWLRATRQGLIPVRPRVRRPRAAVRAVVVRASRLVIAAIDSTSSSSEATVTPPAVTAENSVSSAEHHARRAGPSTVPTAAGAAGTTAARANSRPSTR